MGPKGIGERVRERRAGMGLSQQDLAVLLETTKMRVHRLETNQVRIGAAELPGLADALGVSVAWLLGIDGAEEPEPALISALKRRALELSPEHRAKLADEIRRLPRRPQARCAARPEADNQAYRKAG